MNRFKSVDWLAIVLYPLVILMEAFWVYPWLVWLGFWPTFAESRPALSLASVIIVLAASLLVTRLFIRQRWPLWLIRFVVVSCGLVTIFLVLRVEYGAGDTLLNGWFMHMAQMLGATFTCPYPVVLALPVLLYLWWRGIQLGRTTSYSGSIYRSFVIGIVALIILIIIWQLSAGAGKIQGPISTIGWYIILLFFFGLVAMGIRHLHLMRHSMIREEATLTSAWRLLPIMIGVVGGIVVVGLGIASLFSPVFLEAIADGGRVVFNTLGKVFEYISIPFQYLFDGLFWLMQLILSGIRLSEPPEFENGGGSPFENIEYVPVDIPQIVTTVLQWLVVAVIVATIIYVLMMAIYRYRAGRDREEIEEIHESLWSWNGFQDDLRLFLSIMGQKFKRKPAPVLPRYHIDDMSRRLDIREIFRHLLWEGARSGIDRRCHETACEYTERLGQAVPDGREQLTQLTDLYIGVRYGDISAEEEQVDCANSLWQALRGLLLRLRGDQL